MTALRTFRCPTTLARRALMATALVALTACGSSDDGDGGSGAPARVVELRALEYEFQADEATTIETGDTVEFRVTNVGDIDHELEVLTAENRSLGKTERISPGATRSVTVTFDDAGLYQVICDIDDHRLLGQNAQFEVTNAG